MADVRLETMKAAWATHQASGTVPPLLETQMSQGLATLAGDDAALTRVWDRIAHTVDKAAQLQTVEKAAKKEDVSTAAEAAARNFVGSRTNCREQPMCRTRTF